jgi:flagellar biosynthesis protein FliR
LKRCRDKAGIPVTFDLDPLLQLWTFNAVLVFARVGAALMLLPGFGDFRVPTRLRLLFALALTALVLPAVSAQLPPAPAAFSQTLLYLFHELAIGLFIGAAAAVFMSVLHMAGSIIAGQIGLSNALTGELFSIEQGAAIGAMLTAAGLVVIFVTGLDHLMLVGLVHSYERFPVAEAPMLEDMAETMSRALAASFDAAMRLSAPFLILGFVFNIGLGLANRMMQQLPVFFVGLPVSLAGGLLVLSLAMPALLLGFAEEFEALLANLVF